MGGEDDVSKMLRTLNCLVEFQNFVPSFTELELSCFDISFDFV